jgi:mannose-1-phosphate guanylyltransferase
VIAFVEKPPKDEAPTNLINAGIYVLEPDVLDLIPDGRRVSVERETFPALAEKGALYARADEAYWLDTGTPEAYLLAQSDILAGIRLAGIRGEPPAPGAERDSGGAWVIGAPIVDGSADARSLIGDGALVESGAVVAGSVVGAGCVVGAGATVTGSVLLAGSRVGGGSQIESSIIGSRARVGREANLSGMSIVGSDEVVPDHTVAVSARLPNA